ncbi:MAG: glycosyl hydrolase family 18 protein [Oscillospiraceae bacterium]|nr:glycosyl hydrolase family 18 protein [Oscillospiraceae bacterium]
MNRFAAAIAVLGALLLAGCAGSQQVPAPEPTPTPVFEEPAPVAVQEQEEEESPMKHQVIVYFANWRLNESAEFFHGEVSGIPWDSVSSVNHAFWAVEPVEGTEETSFQRRASGAGARTEFRIVSLNPDMDLNDTEPSKLNPELPRNHFAQYAAMSEKYPDVDIMLSIGGWTRCGFFSEMAYTAEGRASFISSCLDVMQQYPWLDGIDIDWEYPAGSRDGERTPGDEEDQGCPIFGSAKEDRSNFTSLLRELRAAMDAAYGQGTKKLTACASGSTGWTLPCQDWASAAEYLDSINIMTYDLAGPWDGVTGFASSATLSKSGAMYFKMEKIPLEKLCVGSPLYGSAVKMKELRINHVGTAVEPARPTGRELTQRELQQFEQEAVSGYEYLFEDGRWKMGEHFDRGGTGWHYDYDERNGAAFLVNDDETSPYYMWFVSYENRLSLQEKLDYICEKGIGGIIVWECSHDTLNAQMLHQMGDALLNK